MTALDRLLDRIGDPLDASKPRPLVTLEEFFTENTDADSIGHTARTRCSPPEFFAALKNQLAVDGFSDIRVEILPELSPNGWPRAETFWVVSRFDRRAIASAMTTEFWDHYMPYDWLSYPRLDGAVLEPLTVPADSHVFGFDYP